MGPCWHQVALKTNPKTNQKIDIIFHRLQIDFWWILASNLGAPGGHANRVFGVYFALGAVLGSIWPQKGLQGPIFNDFWLIFGRFLVDF